MSIGKLSVVGLALLLASSTSCKPGVGEGGNKGGDKIVRVSRQNNSGTYHYFREAVLGENREFKLGSIDQSGSKDVVTLVEKTPAAIGYSGIAYATPEVKVLKVSAKKGEAGVVPGLESVRAGTYPIARPLLIYTLGEPSGALKHFLDWTLSKDGQKIVGDIGYIPLETPGPDVSPTDAKATIRSTGSDTMVNLVQAWAEAYGKEYPGISIQVSGGGSGVGIAGLIDGTVDIANSSRRMRASEIERCKQKNGVEPKEYIVGQDALAVYVHKTNPLDAISVEELAEIYGQDGTIETWAQITAAP
jgi:ABC-type phosphate transport system substrate-binding protein